MGAAAGADAGAEPLAVAPDPADVVGPAAEAAPAGATSVESVVATAPGGGATSDWPHEGHVTHAGSSTILRQFGQRFGANGSGWLQ
jgi:hypothetical protein